jgi:hypothetical protein
METDLFLMLGDNAYGTGTDAEYQAAVFETYKELLRHTPVWPTLGNHEESPDYFAMFTLPRDGEAGGLASGTENYYSFDYGNIHIVCLDSSLTDFSVGSPMLTWLRNDLSETSKDWIIAFWHHPPYTKGDYNSDVQPHMAAIRQNILPVLDAHGVDLVMAGHSHVYERSMLLNGHYGPSWTLQPQMILNDKSGRADLNEGYVKPAGGMGEYQGCVFVVCGCSGQGGLSEGMELHPAMKTNRGGFGSLVLQIDGLRLDGRFLRPSGDIDDFFTIDKSATSATNRPELYMSRGTDSVVLSWPTAKPNFLLETSPFAAATNWQPVTQSAQQNGRRNSVVLPFVGTQSFFRLRR